MARNPYSGQIFSELVSGNLFQADQITGPFICIVGTASSGPTYTLKRIASPQQAADLFEDGGDTDTAFMRDIALAFDQGGDAITVYAMRIGGKKGSLTFTQDTSSAELYIEPAYEDAQVFENYKAVFMQSAINSGKQRILIYDDELDTVVYDTDSIIVPDLGLFKVSLDSDWDGYYTVGTDSNNQPDFEGSGTPTLAELFADTNGATYLTATNHSGSDKAQATGSETPDDGKVLSRPEYYACLTKAYSLISTRYMDYIVPSGVYFDEPNITDTDDGRDQSNTLATMVYDSANLDWSAVPTRDTADDILGYAWHYRYKGRTFTMMTHALDIFTGSQSLDSLKDIGTIDENATADGTFVYYDSAGVLVKSFSASVDWAAMAKLLTYEVAGEKYKVSRLELVLADAVTTATGTFEVSESFNSTSGVLTVTASADITNNGANIPLSTLKTALEATDYVSAVNLFDASGASLVPVATDVLDLGNGALFPAYSNSVALGKFWLSHKELTGEDVPAKVWSKFINEGTQGQLREVNMGHHLAQFCYYASTSYHMCLGFISLSEPEAYNKNDLANYMGALPEYEGWAGKLSDENIKAVGEGLLGNKFLGGSIGYRWRQLKSGSANQGYAFGGLICTKGLGLPNKEPYGIDQSDEKLDQNKRPVDIGRHIIISGAWPVCSFNLGGVNVTDRHPIPAILAAKVFTTPVNQEPFGEVNGAINAAVLLSDSEQQLVSDGYAGDSRIARVTLLDSSAIGGVNYITNISTAAHWTDDYRRISTIRCVNRVVNGLRNLAKRYIGSSFSSAMISSLQTAINGYLKSEQDVGVHQGAIATLSYTRADKINGNMKITLKMVPPFALETITITTSVAADASEL